MFVWNTWDSTESNMHNLPLYGTGTVPFKFNSSFLVPLENTCIERNTTDQLKEELIS